MQSWGPQYRRPVHEVADLGHRGTSKKKKPTQRNIRNFVGSLHFDSASPLPPAARPFALARPEKAIGVDALPLLSTINYAWMRACTVCVI